MVGIWHMYFLIIGEYTLISMAEILVAYANLLVSQVFLMKSVIIKKLV